MFTTNINRIDQIIRIVLGLVLLGLAFVGPKTPWGYAGIVLLVTGFINFCPMYSLLGFSSKKKK